MRMKHQSTLRHRRRGSALKGVFQISRELVDVSMCICSSSRLCAALLVIKNKRNAPMCHSTCMWFMCGGPGMFGSSCLSSLPPHRRFCMHVHVCFPLDVPVLPTPNQSHSAGSSECTPGEPTSRERAGTSQSLTDHMTGRVHNRSIAGEHDNFRTCVSSHGCAICGMCRTRHIGKQHTV